MTEKENFGGDKKLPMRSIFAGPEKIFIDKLTPKFPLWLEGYHLTLMTILWSAGLITFGYLAHRQENYHWLWLSSLMLFLQWFTDSFDGSLGRYRDTGIPKWGFYMDHFLDYVFMVSLLIGYSFLFEGYQQTLIYLLIPIFGCFMISSYLSFGATNEFKITYLLTGPTEIRLWCILFNCAVIIWGIDLIEKILLYFFILSIIGLCIVVFRTQKYIWKVDMEDKKARVKKP